jgi:hypothetical protein
MNNITVSVQNRAHVVHNLHQVIHNLHQIVQSLTQNATKGPLVTPGTGSITVSGHALAGENVEWLITKGSTQIASGSKTYDTEQDVSVTIDHLDAGTTYHVNIKSTPPGQPTTIFDSDEIVS